MPKQIGMFDKRKGKAKTAKGSTVRVDGYHVPRKTITRAGYDVKGHDRKAPKGKGR